MGAMRSMCDDAETQLQLTNEASKTLLERAGSLRRERYFTTSSSDHYNSFSAQTRSRSTQIHCNTVSISFHFERRRSGSHDLARCTGWFSVLRSYGQGRKDSERLSCTYVWRGRSYESRVSDNAMKSQRLS